MTETNHEIRAIITRESSTQGKTYEGRTWHTTRISLVAEGKKISIEDSAAAVERLRLNLHVLEGLAERINSGEIDVEVALREARARRPFVDFRSVA